MTLLALTGGDTALIILAAFWGLLVLALCVVLLNTFRVLESTKMTIDTMREETVPLLREVKGSVERANRELDRVDTMLVTRERHRRPRREALRPGRAGGREPAGEGHQHGCGHPIGLREGAGPEEVKRGVLGRARTWAPARPARSSRRAGRAGRRSGSRRRRSRARRGAACSTSRSSSRSRSRRASARWTSASPSSWRDGRHRRDLRSGEAEPGDPCSPPDPPVDSAAWTARGSARPSLRSSRNADTRVSGRRP